MNIRTCYRLDGHVRKSLGWMSQELEGIFRELGLVQYLHVFIEQGFDTWDTILDITESDLDTLGVKLGHRRKLQRRIANTRGIGNGISLVTSPQPSVEDPKIQLPQPTKPLKLETHETNTVVITKRKYRRHPKPDENAPERPPSAYVLFSNKMRDELKGRNLTFTEIAKLVGENWQSLSQGEKEPFESQAQAIKDKYHSDLAEYKKTPEYRKYMLYLQDFKAKHAAQSQDKEGSKRVKLEWASQNSADATPSRTSRSGSGSEERQGSDPPPNRKLNSEPPAKKETPYSPTPTQTSHHASPDGSVHSPLTASVDRHSAERSPTFSTSPRDPPSIPPRHSNWHDDQRPEHFNPGMSLPSLSDVIDRQRLMGAANPEAAAFGFPRDHMSHSPGPAPSLISSDGRTPLLRKDESGSASSGSSYGFPRTPIEGSLPIHALLATKPNQFDPNQQQSYFQGVPLPSEHKPPFLHQGPNGSGPPATNGFHNGHAHAQPPLANRINHHGYGTQSPPATLPQSGKPDPRLDGMSALLKAGEIVDRRTQ